MTDPTLIARRLPIVGVMGSGSRPHESRSEPLGRWLAEIGVHLLTGGGGGVMSAVCKWFCEVEGRKGSTIGVIPWDEKAGRPKRRYPNRWIDIPIFTHLPLSGKEGKDPLSRNHINVLSSDVIVALPGSDGTASEVELALEYGRPLVAFVQSRREIPGLGEAVPMSAELPAIQAFVSEWLTTVVG